VFRVDKDQTIGNAALFDQLFHIIVNGDNLPALGDIHPEFSGECFHFLLFYLIRDDEE
tara:strand:+ start:4613 stop:4786 length:174 start_codon:yes stop_codon:yes gene_type:complete